MSIADIVFRERRSGWAGTFERALRRRMALAIAVSIVLHLAATMLVERSEILHVETAQGQPLSARIAPLRPVAVAAPAAMPAPTPKPKARPKPPPRPPRVVEAVLPPEPARDPVPEVTPPVEPPPVEVAKPEAEATPPVEAEAASTPGAAPIAFPERIDLEFNLSSGPNGAPIGRVVHSFEREGDRYLIRSSTEATGLGALFARGKFVQESRGLITAGGLRPERFLVQRGREGRNEVASFDWETSKATLAAGGNSREWDLQPGAQDLLSFMHQLSFIVGDPKPPAVLVTTGRRFDTVRIEALGIEMVETDLGPISTLHFRNQSSNDGLRFDVWLAPDYGNLPVKIRLRDRRGEEAEQTLATMKVR